MNSGIGRPDLMQPGTFMFEANRLAQRLNNLILFGRIFEADYVRGKVRVGISMAGGDPIQTDWLPWMTLRAGKNRTWMAPEVGEQVMVVSPNGNMVNAVVLMGLNWTDYIHEAQSPDIEKEVWINHESAYLEFNRANWLRRFYLNQEGTFAWGVGAASNIVMDKNHIELRVGANKLVLTQSGISLHVGGTSTELVLTPENLLAHVKGKAVMEMKEDAIQHRVNEKGLHTITDDRIESRVVGEEDSSETEGGEAEEQVAIHSVEKGKIESSVKGEGLHKVMRDMVEASVKQNGYHRVKENTIETELMEQQVRMIMSSDTFRVMVKQAVSEVLAETAKISVLGSKMEWTAPAIVATSPAFQGVQAVAQPNEYAGGAAPTFNEPDEPEEIEIPAAPASKQFPPHSTGNPPKYPRGDKMAAQ